MFSRLIRSAAYAGNFERLNGLVTTFFAKFKLTPDEKILAAHAIYRTSGGKGTEAIKAVTEITKAYQGSGGKISGEALRCVGEIAFKRAYAEVPKYESVKLAGGSVDALAASIDRKAGGLEKVKRAMDSVISTKDSYWGVAALYENGKAYEGLAVEMENPPAIKGATTDDVKKKLAPQAQAARQQAASFYKIAIDTMGKFHVYNDYSRRVISASAKANGSKLVMEDWVEVPDLVGSEVSESVASEIR
jgi:hypothetical protein